MWSPTDQGVVENIIKNENSVVKNAIKLAYSNILYSSGHDSRGNFMLGVLLCSILESEHIRNPEDKRQLAVFAEDALKEALQAELSWRKNGVSMPPKEYIGKLFDIINQYKVE